jgi:hypothetical protein
MHVSEVRKLMSGANKQWPPPSEQARWNQARGFRIRYHNNPAEVHALRSLSADLLPTFCPTPIVRDGARFSAQLLFSEPAKVTIEGDIEAAALERFIEDNDLHTFLFAAAQRIAAEGEGGLRIARDDEVDTPLITFEPAEHVIWSTRYGKQEGGVVILEVEDDKKRVFRMLVWHSPSLIRRRLHRGDKVSLGPAIGFSMGPAEFRDLKPEVLTGVEAPTLIPWLNGPDGLPDLAGCGPLIAQLEDAFSVGWRKMDASEPQVFLANNLFDEKGRADIRGKPIVMRKGMPAGTDDKPEDWISKMRWEIGAEDHVRYVEAIKEEILSRAGYSLSSWGLERGGSADSGKALRLRQSRTLLTRMSKELMARGALQDMFSVVLGMMLSRQDTSLLKPEVAFADGMPSDRGELAEELKVLREASLISTAQALRELYPDWPEDRVQEELLQLDRCTR